ncbi:MAG: 2-C-methyl-D-erythritol 4-phosphate cytidylyltransferase [Candidatus Omnitrophica bacterium]|nr:2-C-methyl-D-erythritol 4-phosphate cytidylyltransferase [Candidatus Omnitrophota bacterium]
MLKLLNTMYISCIILAAGKGSRFDRNNDKLLIRLAKKKLLSYSIGTFQRHPQINEIIVVASRKNKSQIQHLVKKEGFTKVKRIVLGGKRRQDSVAEGVKVTSPHTEIVIIHDGARPFVEESLVTKLIKKVRFWGAAILAVPVKETIKQIEINTVNHEMLVEKTLKRDTLWQVQTPQAFHKRLIEEAIAKFVKEDVTDDASLVEKIGLPVAVVLGSYENIKVTTAEDALIAQALAKRKA